MIVRVDQQVRALFPTENFFGTICDHFIYIHICTGSGTALNCINNKFVTKFAVYNFIAGFDDGRCFGNRKSESTPVGECGGFFYFCQVLNEKWM